MDKPVIADREPCEIAVKKGESYWWCKCGRSSTQPLCDGSHAGTCFEPVEYVAKRDRTMWFCTCKHTKKPPYCDGSHNDLPE